MEKLLNEDNRQQVSEYIQQIKEPVQVIFFGKKSDCEYCDETRQMADEITSLSDKLELAVYDIEDDQALASQYKVDKAPGIVIAGLDGDQVLDFGIRFSGIPSGHEFSSLVHDMILVSGRDSGLSTKTRDFLKDLDKPVHLQVFVTPT
jgi:glutaredoxin-like protein